MAKVIKPTDDLEDIPFYGVSVFLAGSIEMGAAEDWQEKITKEFQGIEDLTFFNPRRDSWDSSWEQSQKNPEFNYQVNWELSLLEKSDIIFLYFSPETKSPISLLELGLFAASEPEKMIVCCPDGFWRKGNVEITCTRFRVPFFDDIENAKGALRSFITSKKLI